MSRSSELNSDLLDSDCFQAGSRFTHRDIPAERTLVRRYVMPLLLIVAVGTPIWLVFFSDRIHLTDVFQSRQTGIESGIQPDRAPISVYSQAAFANPAPNLNYAAHSTNNLPPFGTMPNMVGISSGIEPNVGRPLAPVGSPPNLNAKSATASQPVPNIGGVPVVSNDVFQTMGGQTFVFPGTASAPDLTAAPMEFVPTVNLADLFRFDVDPTWVKNRWERVSTSPGEIGLNGLRVAVVTGTNRSDLHGSLTYLFDGNQRCQRITFRGWTGDNAKLVSLLTQKYGFQPQPTKWAGFYLGKKRRSPSGGLLMKHPTVINAQNPSQQIAMVLEINNPDGQYALSNRFLSLIEAARLIP